MPRQFWNSEKTNESLASLRSMTGQVDFVLIGGWAVYLYTRIQKSEDIDVAVDYDNLAFFRRFGISDYSGINIKYTSIGNTVVDLFIEGYADKDVPVPVGRILKEYTVIDGIKVAGKELLLLLKLWGYFRNDETKLKKDVVDALCLLFYSDMDLGLFRKYIDEYKIDRRRGVDVLLEFLDRGRPLHSYVCDGEAEYSRLRERYKKEINDIFG